MLETNGVKSELAKVIERIQTRPGRATGSFLVVLANGDQVLQHHLRLRFDTARAAAAKAAEEANKKDLA
jgi:hypothetical protein